MDKKTTPASPSFNHAAQPTDGKVGNGKSSGSEPKKPAPKLTLEMKGDIGRASRAMSFYKSNSALVSNSRNRTSGGARLGNPQDSPSRETSSERGGLTETFNPAAKGNDGHDHSR